MLRACLITLILLCAACQQDTAKTTRPAGHTAIHVRQHAVRIAERMSTRRPLECASLPLAMRLERWGTFTSTTRIQVHRLDSSNNAPHDSTPLLDTITRLRSDAKGHLNFLEHVRYTTPAGESGEHTRELRRVGGQWFLREDQPRFIQMGGLPGDAMRILTEGSEAFERLRALDPQNPCPIPSGSRRAWLGLIPETLRITSLEHRVERSEEDGLPRKRRLYATFQLPPPHDAHRISVTLDEEHRSGAAEPIFSPPEPLPDHPLDRSYWSIRHLMLRALMRRASPEGMPFGRE